MRFDILTLFPEMFTGYLGQSVLRRAIDRGTVKVQLHNIREWAADKLGKIDKATYVQEVIKADFAEPGDEAIFKKIQSDFKKINISIPDEEIREQMKLTLERAKKDFI